MVYVGMDVHRKRSQVSVMDEGGQELLNRNILNDSGELLSILTPFDPGTPVAFEAAYGWGWLLELLQDLDLEPHLAHPSRCKAIAAARLKNDKVDARTLAHLLRTDLLPEAWIAPRKVRDLRALLRHRAFLVKLSTALKNRIRAILADQGLRPPHRLWYDPGRTWLASADLPLVSREIVDDCLALVDAIDPLIRRLEGTVLAMAAPDPRVEALTTLHGVGPLTAMTLVAEIGDISRFPTARKLCSWAGLTPTVRNSDRRVRHGHISKQGPPSVRWVLVEAAHKAKSRPPFASDFSKTARRRGKNIATVKVARKLLTRAFHLLKDVGDRQALGDGLRAG